MAELLLELLSEEIPARMQTRAAEDFQRLVCDGLKGAGLDFSAARAFATPRRLALVVDGLPATRADVSEERRGPRVGAPDQAIQGFLKGAGLASLDQAEKRDTGRGEFWFAVIAKKGGPTAEVLPGIIDAAMKALPWPKSMRWGSSTMSWVRPLHSIIALFDGKVLAGEVSPGGAMTPIRFGATTRGHRFLSKGTFDVAGFDDYQAKLRAAHVLLDAAERKTIILAGAEKACAEAQVSLRADEALLDEVAGLVEWPVPLLGTIDAQFMDVPPEVLTVSMKAHQRYFATARQDGTFANRFVVVANNVARDGGATIVGGNERVLRSRLSDAKFFWDQDRKLRLEERLPKLAGIVFHAKLGSQAERVERITQVAKAFAEKTYGAEYAERVKIASQLCKADLVSGMVGEFPELQGIMGGYYALEEGRGGDIAQAISEHYQPLGPNDRCPSAPAAVAVALADKIDQLYSFWSIGEKPTGSRDPYALRRAALGVIRIIVENELRVDLSQLLVAARDAVIEPKIVNMRQEMARSIREKHVSAIESFVEIQAYQEVRDKWPHLYALLEQKDSIQGPLPISDGEALDLADLYVGRWSAVEFQATTNTIWSILEFIADRLKVQVRDRGVRFDIVDAVFALGNEHDLVRLLARVEAVQAFLATEAGKNLLTAYGRAANIVRAEERKDKTLSARIAGAPDGALMEQNEERAVLSALAAVEQRVGPALASEDFAGAMTALADLRAPIDAFFDKVTVNVSDKPDLRLNRLKLLNQIRATMDKVADFSRIEG